MSRSSGSAVVQRGLLVLAAFTFALYAGNIIVAKLTSLAGVSVPLLSNVAEFLLLLAATAFFISYSLCREAAENGNQELEESSGGTNR